MPVPDASGDDWLQQFLAGHQAAQAFGAYQPYDPAQNPSLTPTAGAPGGGVMGYPAASPGAPSMGYPALGQPADPRPSQMATTAGLNLNSNPFARIFGLFGGKGGPTPPLPVNSLPLAWGNPTGEDYRKWLDMQLGGSQPAGDPAPFHQPDHPSTMRYPGWPTPPAPAAPTTAPPAPRSVKRTDAAYGPYGAPAGSPSQTPRPASSSADRWLIERQNAPATGYSPGTRSGTALDLSSLFRKRG